MEQKKQISGLAIASLVIGILSLLLSCCYGGFLGIIGIGLGIAGICTSNKKGMAIWGLVLSVISLFITIICLIFGFAILDELENDNSNTDSSNISSSNEIVNNQKDRNTDLEPGNTIDENTFTYGHSNIKYINHEIIQNNNEDVLVVYYEFTNNEDEPKAFGTFVTGKAFQNGIEVDQSWIYVNDECKNAGKEVQKGTTITVANSYPITDTSSNITIEFRPFNIWSDDLLWSIDIELE